MAARQFHTASLPTTAGVMRHCVSLPVRLVGRCSIVGVECADRSLLLLRLLYAWRHLWRAAPWERRQLRRQTRGRGERRQHVSEPASAAQQ